RQGHHNPSGARTSGRRWGAQRHRSAHRGGEPDRRTRVSKAGANASRSAGMSGIRRKRGARRRKGPDRTAWCLSVKPYWGKPTGRHLRGGGWKRERWLDEAPAPQSRERRSETPNRRLRAPVLYPTGDFGQSVQGVDPRERLRVNPSCHHTPTGQHVRVAKALPEEPDAFIAHVRVCGRAGGVTTGSTRTLTAS